MRDREIRIPRREPVPPPPDPVESEPYVVIMDCWTFVEQIRKAREAERNSKS